MGIEARISGRDKAPWFKCRGCHKSYWAEWWHCTHCHDTFDKDVTSWHRVEGSCIPPKRNGMTFIDGAWQG